MENFDMRRITLNAMMAFRNSQPWASGNTHVSVGINGDTYLSLHGYQIAKKDKAGVKRFSLCGWATPTTRERMQAADIQIAQRKHLQYYINPHTREETEIDKHSVYEIKNDGSIEEVKQNAYFRS